MLAEAEFENSILIIIERYLLIDRHTYLRVMSRKRGKRIENYVILRKLIEEKVLATSLLIHERYHISLQLLLQQG